MKTIEEMLQNLGRSNVTEFALVSDRLPCVKVNGTFKPVDDYAPNTDEILQMLVAAGGSWYIASLGPTATQWTINVEGLGTVGVQAIMRERNVQARFMVAHRDPFAVAAPQAPPPPPPIEPLRPSPSRIGGPPSTMQGRAVRPNPPFPPPPPSSAVALIANEPFLDDEPRTGSAHQTQQAAPNLSARPRPVPARPAPPATPPLVAMEPGKDDAPADDFDFPGPKKPLPVPASPEVSAWAALQTPGAPMRPPQASRPEMPRLDPPAAAPGEPMDARAEMDSLVLRLAEELDVGPRRVRVVIELVLETIDRTGLPPREALEALAAAEKAAKKK